MFVGIFGERIKAHKKKKPTENCAHLTKAMNMHYYHNSDLIIEHFLLRNIKNNYFYVKVTHKSNFFFSFCQP